ncbi:MAG: hypothetical protein GX638_07115 [Crenarchaeota archaeon]|nr:hypothetical protein [Thermoproteota archaeon]
MKAILDFADHFGAKLSLNSEFIIQQGQCFFLLNSRLRKMLHKDFFYAGLYLGKIKDDVFFPSFGLLKMIADIAENKVVLDRKGAWLFICGRDVFKKSIIRVCGDSQLGNLTLVVNEFGECLGFGQIIENLANCGAVVVVKNLVDVGDFLRRER